MPTKSDCSFQISNTPDISFVPSKSAISSADKRCSLASLKVKQNYCQCIINIAAAFVDRLFQAEIEIRRRSRFMLLSGMLISLKARDL
jgi:hypothetical protein